MKYLIFDPQVDGPCHLLSRKEAKISFDWLISQKEVRVKMLSHELERKGFPLPDSHEALCEVFEQVLIHEVTKAGRKLTGYIYSLCLDMGIYLGEELIRLSPEIRWVLHTFRKTDPSYQRPVLVGFDVPNKKFNYDFDFILCAYINRLATDGDEYGLVLKMFNGAKSYLPA